MLRKGGRISKFSKKIGKGKEEEKKKEYTHISLLISLEFLIFAVIYSFLCMCYLI